MALPWSVPDLSSITAELVAMLQTAVNTSVIPPFNVQVSGSMPETVRDSGSCQLTLYLLHVGRDPHWRNTPRQGPRPLLNTAQPLSLTLTYLLSAYADADFVSEQQAMSIALHCFHEQPLFHGNGQEFTISIEADTVEEMSRLWQAITVPIRLSSVIKVGVVFITPTALPPTLSPTPVRAGLVVAPAMQAGAVPQLFGLATEANFTLGSATDPSSVTVQTAPVVLTGGQDAVLGGSMLDQPAATDLYLGLPGGMPWQVTGWRQASASSDLLRLALPAAYVTPGATAPVPPVVMPPPGIYQLLLGSAAGPVASASIPVAIAARIDGPAAPQALAPDGGGLYTLTGEGFTPGATALVLDTVALAPAAASDPAAGFAFVDAAGKTITFRTPALPSGRYTVRVRVGGVESPSAYWVDLP
jgi:hypothetical protein